jgi:hypothetical protein
MTSQEQMFAIPTVLRQLRVTSALLETEDEINPLVQARRHELQCVKLHIDRETCVRRVQRTQMNVMIALALPAEQH